MLREVAEDIGWRRKRRLRPGFDREGEILIETYFVLGFPRFSLLKRLCTAR
jgi:hypothetical protein